MVSTSVCLVSIRDEYIFLFLFIDYCRDYSTYKKQAGYFNRYNFNHYNIQSIFTLSLEWVFRRTNHSHSMLEWWAIQSIYYWSMERKMDDGTKIFDMRIKTSQWCFKLFDVSSEEKKSGRFSLPRSDLINSSRELNRLLLDDVNGLSRRIKCPRWGNCFKWFNSSKFFN